MMSPNVQPSPEIWHRDDLPLLCNWRKLWRAAEVGVERGLWARLFLDRWQGHEWWGIDDWQPYPEMTFGRDAEYLTTVANLQPHAARTKLLRASSAEASALFAPGSLDFVYLDAAHDYESVKADIGFWWPKLSGHGVLAGHDFDGGHPGVVGAVTEFAESHQLTVYLTAVTGYNREGCPSWYAYRSGMPGRDWRRC